MNRVHNRTNKKYYITQVGPCPMCGFAKQINDYEAAQKLGVPYVVVDCPTCKGRGEWIEMEYTLEDALTNIDIIGQVVSSASSQIRERYEQRIAALEKQVEHLGDVVGRMQETGGAYDRAF